MPKPIIVDAHEDLAWNARTFSRDYRYSAKEIRSREQGTLAPVHNGNTLLGKADWLSGNVAVVFGTLYSAPVRKAEGLWDTQAYDSPEEANRLIKAQVAYYQSLVESDPVFRQILTTSDLESVLATWHDDDNDHSKESCQIGLVMLMEGADGILDPAHLEEWYDDGVRAIGPAWVSTRYAGGTHEPGPLTDLGKELLKRMQRLGLILDFSHLAEQACYQALELFDGTVVATHANPRRFLPTDRGLSDEMITLLSERGGVIGIVPYNRFLLPGWSVDNPRAVVPLSKVADAIDHVCQLTGSSEHVGVGTDFDGGFGVESVPEGIDTIADLPKISQILEDRGYRESEIRNIMSGNWLRILRKSLPES